MKEDGFEYMKAHGVWQDMSKPKYYDLYNWDLKPEEVSGTRVDDTTQIIYRKAATGGESPVGIMIEGKPKRGFITPSRKFSVYHPDIEAAAKIGRAHV